jgi:hypothetical protein
MQLPRHSRVFKRYCSHVATPLNLCFRKCGLITGYRKSFQVSNEGRPAGGGAGGGEDTTSRDTPSGTSSMGRSRAERDALKKCLAAFPSYVKAGTSFTDDSQRFTDDSKKRWCPTPPPDHTEKGFVSLCITSRRGVGGGFPPASYHSSKLVFL